MSSIHIFFVSPSSNSGFIKNDLIILKRHFCVKELHYRGFFSLVSLLPQLIKGIFWSDIVFIWFASYHALLSIAISKIFGKRTILVVGGYEVVNESAINYGLMKSRFTSWIPKVSILYATKVICVSDYSQKETIKNTGCRNLIRIYNGIDVDKFNPIFERKENIVITVGNIYNSTFHLKGLKTFFEVATNIPDVQFFVIGGVDLKFKDSISDTIPSNVCFKGKLQTEDLLSIYRKSKVYCQLSYVESFGVSLAEAMACECVPVITNKGALPEVVGNAGFYVTYGDAKTTANTIMDALKSDKGKASRAQIVNNYPLSLREKKLVDLINSTKRSDTHVNNFKKNILFKKM